MKKAEDAIVDEPQAGSPASKSGITAGDVVLTINGVPVKDSGDLARKIAMMAPAAR
jgi:serine protease Do